MLIYIWDLSTENHKCVLSVMQTEQQKRTHICREKGQICVCFFAVLEGGPHKQNCEVWLHSDKTRVSKGSPFGTQPLEQRCSVLYALSALGRKCGCRRVGQGHLKQPENRAVFEAGQAANTGLFSVADRAYMKAPVHRSRPGVGTKCPDVAAYGHGGQKQGRRFRSPKSNGGRNSHKGVYPALIAHQKRRLRLAFLFCFKIAERLLSSFTNLLHFCKGHKAEDHFKDNKHCIQKHTHH